jgi:hypothetical protein
MYALWMTLNPSNGLVANVAEKTTHTLPTRDHAWSRNSWAAPVIVVDMNSVPALKLQRLIACSAAIRLLIPPCHVLLNGQSMAPELHAQFLQRPFLRRYSFSVGSLVQSLLGWVLLLACSH